MHTPPEPTSAGHILYLWGALFAKAAGPHARQSPVCAQPQPSPVCVQHAHSPKLPRAPRCQQSSEETMLSDVLCSLQERALSSSSEWRSQIQAVDREVLSHLQHNIAGGFDQERFGPSIGFGNLKRY